MNKILKDWYDENLDFEKDPVRSVNYPVNAWLYIYIYRRSVPLSRYSVLDSDDCNVACKSTGAVPHELVDIIHDGQFYYFS